MKRTSPIRRRRRDRRGWLVLLPVAVVVIWALWPRQPPPRAPSVPQQIANAPKYAPVPFEHYEPPQPSKKIFPSTPEFRRDFNARKAAMTEEALKSVEEWIKYPLWSSRLTENMRYHKMEPYHMRAPSPGGEDPTMEIWPEKVEYKPGEQINIVANFWGKNHTQIAPDSVEAHTVGGMGSHPRPSYPLEFTRRGDGSYVATLTVDAGAAYSYRGEWGVQAEAFVEGERRVGHASFHIMATDAAVTGPYRITVEDGSLVAYVGIEATRRSRQHLKAELWGPKGEPISYAWVRNDDTPPGKSTMKLVFYGKVVRDSGVDGPYTLRNLLLTTFADDNERIFGAPVDPGPTSEAYAHTIFTDVPINGTNETLVEKRQILSEELAMAKSNGYDPNNMTPPREPVASKDGPPPQ